MNTPAATSPARRLGDLLRAEVVGGVLLVGAAVLALLFANSPWRDAYTALAGFTVGPAALHLDLPLATWAADGLLAIFFFVVGLELKREFLAGDLRDPRHALLPCTAAVGGMIAPALIYVAINLSNPDALVGWAIPTATDIAFAVAVLAVLGSSLPAALRIFLLTLAVVDDLLAITIIAIFYTEQLSAPALLGALVPLALFTLAVQRGVRAWWVLLPLAALTWVLVHASGVHATVAGVLLGFAVPVLGHRRVHGVSLSEHFEHRWRPISAGFAVPVFAFFAAGVTVVGGGNLGAALTDTVTLGIIVGLVVGKTVGVLGATWLVQRFTAARLSPDLGWWDVLGLAQLAGIGFTVSLLVGELAFGTGTPQDDHVKIGVLTGSLTAVLLATVVLRIRNAHHRRLADGDRGR
ncbi:sodium/proton antiporter, NhaA family [Pseudonocardia ammonioxydans]|uniref:Na(+)/H(+) antiporter NhaA n=1 Tax=Pseudonocardia ammonioxydans TaxID=260086 RepID=A0A1I5DDJ9_PSUAM|nr:Na+/H+ antiporter NhaA [Pseudonocardia ammonioxydans]SFN97315.1 sodium/proton antiporter, NhaA family [Pseudonocardia ammonioxydans]